MDGANNTRWKHERGRGTRFAEFGCRLAVAGLLLSLAQVSLGNRGITKLDMGWKFFRGDAPQAETSAFDDRTWKSVQVPHTWNVEDGADGGSYYRGPGWYRLHFELSDAVFKKRLFLRFGAASLVAKVYLNGHEVGEHRGGFAAFAFPISRFVKSGANELAVRVDNSRNTDVTPLSGDFTIYGGIYRPVELISMNEVGVSPMDDGGPGVYLTPKLGKDVAEVEVRTLVLGSGGPVAVRSIVKDANGRIIALGEVSGTVQSDETKEFAATLKIVHPHLWDGVRDPYLYHVHIQVIRGKRVLDEVVQHLGLRNFHVDTVRGFLLNDKPYDLHGVNIHQGRPSVGWAATSSMADADYSLIREMGCTGVRMAHYQHSDHESEICDRLGLAVWAELALVNQVSNTPEFRSNAQQQLRELIKQNYNHPSVMFWSLYNEPWLDAKSEPGMRQIEGLAELARRLDPSRMSTGAAVTPLNNWLTNVGDLASVNKYWGWYGGSPTNWPAELDKLRKAAPNRTFGMSEYGAGASLSQHEIPPRQPNPNSKWHPEEWASFFHENAWSGLSNRPYIWNKFVWVMFDFASDGRNEGDHPGINDKGLVAADHKTRKDDFYYYKAQWTTVPFVHLNSSRFNPRPAGTTEIRAYSNVSHLVLTIDGKSLGEMTRTASGVFVKNDVELVPGYHIVEARGDGNVQDRLRWTVTDVAKSPAVVGKP